MHTTCHSEYGKLSSVYIKPVEQAFIDAATIARDWRALNFLDRPDLDKALAEYDRFEDLLANSGADIHHFPADPALSIDSIYCRDAAIATDFGMIICTMGKPARTLEPAAQEKFFIESGEPILGTITYPGTLEGGDVAWLDESTLAVGHTYRTNTEGIRQLKALLEPRGITIITVPLPHYKGPGDVFHLMSILSPVDQNLAVVYSPLMPIIFRNELIARGFSLVEVPDSEFDSMGCNVLAIAPRVCLVVSGNPQTKAALLQAGCTVLDYEGQEISVKGGGGPTCLTRPIRRSI